MSSWPGQNGQDASSSGEGSSSFGRAAPGRMARAGAIATRRPVSSSTRRSVRAIEERCQQVDRCGKDDRRRLGRTELEQRLQVAELQGDWMILDHERRVLQPLARLELTLRV